jgi:hypothetical protein
MTPEEFQELAEDFAMPFLLDVDPETGEAVVHEYRSVFDDE